MSGSRVLLMQLSERTSKGIAYLSGWLGKARVVAFKAKEPDKFGKEQWEVFVQEPDRDQAPRQQSPTRNAERGQRVHDRARAAGRAQQAGEAVLAAAKRDRTPEPPADWLDDSEAAIRDLEGRDR